MKKKKAAEKSEKRAADVKKSAADKKTPEHKKSADDKVKKEKETVLRPAQPKRRLLKNGAVQNSAVADGADLSESEGTLTAREDLACYKNRELSWLQFNERVLNEAANPNVKLAERLSFTAIYQSNLDEFFMVRVGTLMMQMHSIEPIRENKTNLTSKEQVTEILKRVHELELKKTKVYEQLMGELEPHNVRIINFNRLSKEEGVLLEAYFDHQIAPYLSPMIVGKQQPFPFINNKELYAIVTLRSKNSKSKNGKTRTGIVSCENKVFKRLIEIPTRPGTFMLSEELILHFVQKLFPKYAVAEKSILRLTRNADIDAGDVYDEAMDYRDIMEQLIKKRKRLSPVRLELSRPINEKTKGELAKVFGLGKDHIINVGTPLDLSFVFLLQDYLHDNTALFYEKRSPRNPGSLNLREPLIPQIEKKDVLLAYPFESMKPFLQLLSEAAEDPSVISIKMTLYRLADKSKVVDALCEAAENGKDVVALLELRARFDEANNIEMSHRLEDAGCHVIYGLQKYKVHSKLCLITRRTEEGTSYITQIGTGNYNEKTARLYVDLCLITANVLIGEEAGKVFRALLQGETPEGMQHLLVAPHCLRNRVIDMIDGEIARARDGKPAYIGIKINSLTDKVLIEKLIEASKAGVKTELVVRGICCLVPGIPGKTENIRVISIVGRFLEHSRIYRFGTPERDRIYIASADFMTRNTIRRVEVAVPIYDEDLKKRLRDMFSTLMADDEKGKELLADGLYHDRKLGEVKLNSQEKFYADAYKVLSDLNE